MRPEHLLIGLVLVSLVILGWVVSELYQMSDLKDKVDKWRKHRQWKDTQKFIEKITEVSR